MSVEPPDQDRRNRPPIAYIPLRRAEPYRPGALWSAIVHYGIAHGMISPSVAAGIEAAPPSVAPTMPLSTTHTVVISMGPKPAPAPVEAAPPAAAAPVHVAPHAGMGVHSI